MPDPVFRAVPRRLDADPNISTDLAAVLVSLPAPLTSLTRAIHSEHSVRRPPPFRAQNFARGRARCRARGPAIGRPILPPTTTSVPPSTSTLPFSAPFNQYPTSVHFSFAPPYPNTPDRPPNCVPGRPRVVDTQHPTFSNQDVVRRHYSRFARPNPTTSLVHSSTRCAHATIRAGGSNSAIPPPLPRLRRGCAGAWRPLPRSTARSLPSSTPWHAFAR